MIRDSYHRYTVDEHTFVAIENVHSLDHPRNQWEQRLAEIKAHTPQLELLLLALLLHDVGKGVPSDSHVQASDELAAQAVARLGLAEDEQELVLFLIRSHLEMSALLRRDIFAPETSQALAQKVGTPDRLKLLCLLTYADIKAVNPEALTAWKTENLWRLYIAAFNHLNHSADQDALDSTADIERITHVTSLVHRPPEQVQNFLRGLPQRYVRSHSIGQITAPLHAGRPPGSRPGATCPRVQGRPLRSHRCHPQSSSAVCNHRGRALCVGNGYHQGGCLLQQHRNRGGYLSVP